MSPITIYHNPDCGTSRNTLALIRNSGVEPTVILYLQEKYQRQLTMSQKQIQNITESIQTAGIHMRGSQQENLMHSCMTSLRAV